jgi:hypothetical protein
VTTALTVGGGRAHGRGLAAEQGERAQGTCREQGALGFGRSPFICVSSRLNMGVARRPLFPGDGIIRAPAEPG